MRPRNGGFAINGVETGGSAANAGLKVGDVITKINGGSPFEAPFGTFAGKEIKLMVNRDGVESEIPMRVGSRDYIAFNLFEMKNGTPQQMKIRDGWLKR